MENLITGAEALMRSLEHQGHLHCQDLKFIFFCKIL